MSVKRSDNEMMIVVMVGGCRMTMMEVLLEDDTVVVDGQHKCSLSVVSGHLLLVSNIQFWGL